MHPFIAGELACGQLRNRATILGLLARLPSVPTATHSEILEFIGSRKLMGRGMGYVDVHLLAGVALSAGVKLWTRDRRLGQVAEDLGLGVSR